VAQAVPRMGNGVALPIGEVMVIERAWSLDEEIRTPDPQIRSQISGFEIAHIFCKLCRNCNLR
jgi:hypothetical protein